VGTKLVAANVSVSRPSCGIQVKTTRQFASKLPRKMARAPHLEKAAEDYVLIDALETKTKAASVALCSSEPTATGGSSASRSGVT
jgi:hypothetical protein